MQIKIWQQFSSNHSSTFTVVGEFETAEKARYAATEVRGLLKQITKWNQEHPDQQNNYLHPTPPEVEIGKQFGFEWPDAIDWHNSVAVKIVLDRFVYITLNGVSNGSGKPFDKILDGLGGRGLLDGYFDSFEPIGNILTEINCVAPDEATAGEILRKYLNWNHLGKVNGRQVHFYDWNFSDLDLPSVVEDLTNQRCVDIQYHFYQSGDPSGKTRTAADVDVLIQILNLEKQEHVGWIAKILAELGDPRAVDSLIHSLDHANIPDRIEIVKALGDFRDERAIDALIELLKDQETPALASSAAYTLGQIGDIRAVRPLIRFLTDQEQWRWAAGALATIGETAREAVREAIQSTNPILVERAIYTLDLLNQVALLGSVFSELRDSSLETQKAAFEKIKTHPQAVEMLITVLKSPPALWMRLEAMNALAEIGDPRAIDPIIEYLLYTGGSSFSAFERFGTAAVEPLIELVNYDQNWVQMTAVLSLSQIHDPRAADVFLKILVDKQANWVVKQFAAQALVQLGDKRAIQPLVSLFVQIQDRHPNDKWMIEALQRLNGIEALITGLIHELGHNSEARSASRNIGALGQLGDKRAIDPLIALSEHASPIIGQAISAALRQLGYTS